MSTILVRNIPDETHRALRERAVALGRSTEAEVRAILEAVVRPPARLKIGSALQELGKTLRDLNRDFSRGTELAEPIDFA